MQDQHHIEQDAKPHHLIHRGLMFYEDIDEQRLTCVLTSKRHVKENVGLLLAKCL
ncbi:MAG: hypothetical protein OXH00_05830 [Candidatus Poribacteria bacterium]|nr:hypothetical protein [Candidatus Poribacteria bacterium]